MRTHGLARTAAGAALVALTLTTSPAHADQLAQSDRRGDFWHDPRPDSEPYQAELDGGEEPDIRRVVYAHGDRSVRVRVRLQDLDRWGYWLIDVRMRTDDGQRGRLQLFRDNGGGRDAQVSWSGSTSCGATHRIDLDDDLVALTVPCSCLDRPGDVAFRTKSSYWPTSDDYPWVDVAGSPGYDFAGWSAPVARG